MITDNVVTRAPSPGAQRLLVPVFIAIELFAGLVQGWIMPLLGEIGDFHAVPGGSVSWILTIGMLSSAVSVPFLSMLADRFGRRRLLIAAVLLTGAGSLLIALAPTFPMVILGAAIQGPIAALLPIEMGLLKELRPATAQRTVSFLIGSLTLGVAAGSYLGGSLLEATGDLIITQVVPALPFLVLAALLLVCVPRGAGDQGRSVDWTGAVLLSIGLSALMYGLSTGTTAGWLSPVPLGSLLLGVLALAAFLVVEARAEAPLFNLPVLRRVKLGLPLVLGLLIALTAFGLSTPTTLFLTAQASELGYGVGLSAGVAGAIVSIVFLASTLGAFLAPALVRLLSPAVTVAVACAVAGAALLPLLFAPASPALVTAVLAINSLTAWIALSVLPGIVVDRAPLSEAATVSGLYNSGRSLGGSLAGAFVATVMSVLVISSGPGAGNGEPSFAAFQTVWAVFAGVLFLSAVLALFLRRQPTPVSA